MANANQQITVANVLPTESRVLDSMTQRCSPAGIDVRLYIGTVYNCHLMSEIRVGN